MWGKQYIYNPSNYLCNLYLSLFVLQCPHNYWVMEGIIISTKQDINWYYYIATKYLRGFMSVASLNSNNLLYQSQYGFRKDHSTELASIELIYLICKEMEKGDTPISILLDLSKAFDIPNHDILLTKLKHHGIAGTPLAWFKSYLTNRAQYVEINGICSGLLSIEKGVPQGSILGPLLFIIFINNIHRSST